MKKKKKRYSSYQEESFFNQNIAMNLSKRANMACISALEL